MMKNIDELMDTIDTYLDDEKREQVRSELSENYFDSNDVEIRLECLIGKELNFFELDVEMMRCGFQVYLLEGEWTFDELEEMDIPCILEDWGELDKHEKKDMIDEFEKAVSDNFFDFDDFFERFECFFGKEDVFEKIAERGMIFYGDKLIDGFADGEKCIRIKFEVITEYSKDEVTSKYEVAFATYATRIKIKEISALLMLRDIK